MFASLMFVLFVIAPLVGFAAIAFLLLFHEHAQEELVASPPHGRRQARVPRALAEPVVTRRSNTALLYDYLADDREASFLERQQENARLRIALERAHTAVLEEYLEERSGDVQSAVKHSTPVSSTTRNAPPAPAVEPAPRPARKAPVPVYDRAARPTRLMPLTPEMAVG